MYITHVLGRWIMKIFTIFTMYQFLIFVSMINLSIGNFYLTTVVKKIFG